MWISCHRVIPLNASAIEAVARMIERADVLGQPRHAGNDAIVALSFPRERELHGTAADLVTCGSRAAFAKSGRREPTMTGETGDVAGMCLTTVRRPCALVGGTRYVLSSADGIATDINENGAVSGHLFATAERGARPFVWSRATGRRTLDASPYDHGFATAINDYGQVGGALVNDAVDEVPPSVAVRWRSIGRITAVYPDNTGTLAVENHRWVVGSCCWPPDDTNLAYPILWRSGRITRLPLGAESGGWAVDINESGVIVGSVTNDGETSRAAIWRLVQ